MRYFIRKVTNELIPNAACPFWKFPGSRNSAVLRALASHKCDLGSMPA